MPKNAVLASLAVLALGVAGYLMYATASTGPLPSTYTAKAWSFSTNSEVEITYGATETEPFTCPETGNKTAYRLYYCMDEEIKVVPKLTERDGTYVISGYMECPVCGSKNLMAYDPELFPETADAEIVLPKQHP